MGVLDGRNGDIPPLRCRVGATLDEVETGNRRQPHDLVHGEDFRLLDHAIDHEAMFRRVNIPPALVMPLKMQATWGDDSEQGLQGCKRNRRLCRLSESRALSPLHICLVLGRFSVAVGGDTQTQALCVLRQNKDVGVTTFDWHGIDL